MKTDKLIESLEAKLKDWKIRLGLMVERRDQRKKEMVTHDGTVLETVSAEVVQRNVEIERYEEIIQGFEADLKRAIKDLPRREALREKAVSLKAEAEVVDKESQPLQEQLKGLRDKAGSLRSEANEALRQAEVVLA